MLSRPLRSIAVRSTARCVLWLAVAGLGLSPAGSVAFAEPTNPHPLRPADTSSPRDTLKSFLADVEQFADEWRRGDVTTDGFRALVRAIRTLDFHTTPHGDSGSVRTLRVLLLKEVLDRVPVPAFAQIPGAAEVADGSISEWRIPDTPITIARVEEGPRQGEFLFSAETVAQLDRLHLQVQSLPSRAGVEPGIYDDFRLSDRSWYVMAERVRNRLRPIDASSPLSTFEGFLDSVNRAHVLVKEAGRALQSDPPGLGRDEARAMEAQAGDLLLRAVGTLDLREVPAALRHDVGIESALQLKEILDRMPLPPLDSIPGGQRVEAHRNVLGNAPLRWRIPNTEIEIIEITEGERAGDFLFAARTVRGLPSYYERVRDLPYVEGDRSSAVLFGELPTARSEGFYEAYISTPGYLVPRLHFLGRVVEGLPDWMLVVYDGQPVWQWVALGVCVLLLPLASWGIHRGVRGIGRALSPAWAAWSSVLTPATIALLVTLVVDFLDLSVGLTGDVLSVVLSVGEAIVLALAAWGIFLLAIALAESLIASPRIADQSIDASLIRISARVLAFFFAAWIVVDGVRNLGADVVPLLASLGVGGLAVALAAQTTIANFLGSLILFANKPVREGDFCRYGDEIGTVEQIGLISTRVRTLERSVVTVPNAEFSQMKLDNFSKRDQRRLHKTLQLRYETTPEQMRWILAKLRELMLAHPQVTPDPARARFVGYGAYSKDVELFAYLRCRDQNVFLAIQEDLLLRIEEVIEAAGSGFAFPSQTAYLAQDGGLDAERRQDVEGQVGRWRAEQRLPFPYHPREEQRELTDVLDYPPEGSPDHRPGGAEEEAPATQGGRRRSRWYRLLKRDRGS